MTCYVHSYYTRQNGLRHIFTLEHLPYFEEIRKQIFSNKNSELNKLRHFRNIQAQVFYSSNRKQQQSIEGKNNEKCVPR